jgi:hypothetical protein
MNRHSQTGSKVWTRRVCLGGCRDRAALRLQLLDEGDGALGIIPRNILGDNIEVRRGAGR